MPLSSTLSCWATYMRPVKTCTANKKVNKLNNYLLDLTLFSSSLYKPKITHAVKNEWISELKPTITTIWGINSKRTKFTFNKTNWKTFSALLNSELTQTNTPFPLTNAEIDQTAAVLKDTLNTA